MTVRSGHICISLFFFVEFLTQLSLGSSIHDPYSLYLVGNLLSEERNRKLGSAFSRLASLPSWSVKYCSSLFCKAVYYEVSMPLKMSFYRNDLDVYDEGLKQAFHSCLQFYSTSLNLVKSPSPKTSACIALFALMAQLLWLIGFPHTHLLSSSHLWLYFC